MLNYLVEREIEQYISEYPAKSLDELMQSSLFRRTLLLSAAELGTGHVV